MNTFNEKGAISYVADNPLLELFYRSLRNTPPEKMKDMVRKAWQIDKLLTLKLLFHLRWCRGGKGERKLFKLGLSELIEIGESKHILANLNEIPNFGYWKDLLCLVGTDIEKDMVKEYCEQLKKDLDSLKLIKYKKDKKCEHEKLFYILGIDDKEIQPISLAAKWAPSEGKEIDKKHKLVKKFCKYLNMNKKDYRKNYLVPLRTHLDIVERKICTKDFENINYEHLPSLARLRYSKLFLRYDEERYKQYLARVATGESKMNIKLVYPYQLVEKYLFNHITPNKEYPDDETLNTMWNELVKQIRQELVATGANLQALAIADTSGSMEGIPLQNSVALSLLWAELCEGRFNNHFYTFSSRANLIKINGTSLKDKVRNIMDHSTVDNTNLQAVFDDLLHHAKLWSVPVELYPKTIYIFTDAQFDIMTFNSDQTHLSIIQQKHSEAGYPMPQIIFWNLRGDTVDFPSPGNKKGVAMLSGFSPSLLKLILKGKDIDPITIMMNALNDKELDRIKLAE